MRQLSIGFLTVILTFLMACAKSNTTPVTATTPLTGTAAVSGRVYSDPVCGAAQVQVSFMSGATTLYQTNVPANGTFEFQANPGVYSVVARSGSCGAQQSLTVMGNQMAQASLNLTTGGYQQTPQFPTTTTGQYYPQAPQIPNYQPWPTAYYPTSPCAWSYYGCGGWNYPGWGDVGIGKPLLYVHGPAGTQVKIRLKMQDESNLLAASPAQGHAWNFTLEPEGLIFGADRYDSVFYDLRTHSKLLTDQKAFCLGRVELMPSLENYLTNQGFEEREIKDFTDEWTGKIPPGSRFCVYPQEGDVVDKVAELVVEPKPAKITRVWFLIVPERESTGQQANAKSSFLKFLKFNRKASPTMLALLKKNPKRAIASPASSLELREWGVGFLFEPKP